MHAAEEQRAEALRAASGRWVRRATLEAKINAVLDAQATPMF
jgi:hypothetical protein